MKPRNPFAASTLARLTEHRNDPAWLQQALATESTWLLPVWGETVAFAETRLALLTRGEGAGLLEQAREVALLGEHAGAPCFALDMGPDTPEPLPAPLSGTRPAGLRELAAAAPPDEAALAAYARALLYWHRRHRYCGRCGAPTASAQGGHQRRCTDATCGATAFPRTDPAIIVLVEDGERCLLGRQAHWPAGRYSTIAGFVEPAESLEDAVAREVMEETGVRVIESHYHSSQPWPFPASLMLGFTARGEPGPITLFDHELEDARWFSRGDLIAALESGELKMATSISIAFRLVSNWFDAGEPGQLQALLERIHLS
jgi:NAD+ diphosphatase